MISFIPTHAIYTQKVRSINRKQEYSHVVLLTLSMLCQVPSYLYDNSETD